MTFKDFVTPEQFSEMKAMTKAVKALHKVTVTKRHGTTTPDGNKPFIMSERDVFLNDKGVKRVIPLKPIKAKYYHA